MSILINILTVILVFVSLFMILVVLAQKAKTDGGVGGALGGGMTEATFGADTSNVLSRATRNSAIVFFVLTFALYLGHIYIRKHSVATGEALPSIAAPTAARPVSVPAPMVPKKP